MAIVATDMRCTVESARRIRFEPGANTATNVQTAIENGGSGGGAITPTAVNFGMSPYTPLAADQLLLIDTSGGAVTINMVAAAARNGVALEIKDDTGNADANPIAVNRNGAETIDGIASYPIDSKRMAVKFAPKTGGYAVV